VKAGIVLVTSKVAVLLEFQAALIADEWSILRHMAIHVRIQVLMGAVGVVAANSLVG
jgi:hypothetical protein